MNSKEKAMSRKNNSDLIFYHSSSVFYFPNSNTCKSGRFSNTLFNKHLIEMIAIIIEDEKLVARELSIKIAKIDSELKILGILPSVKTSVNWFAENAEPDVVFADIQLTDGVSFEIFEKFQLTCPIIFTTSYNEFAIRAFKVNGIDYLLKPVELEDLKNAIEKAKNLIKNQIKSPINLQKLAAILQHTSSDSKPAFREQFLCNHRNAWVPVKVKEISHFHYDTVIHIITKANEKFSLDNTMDEIEGMLDPNAFFRINRQFIVNKDMIQRVWGLENLKLMVKLKDPHQSVEIDISRQKAPVFKKWLEK